MPSQGREEEGRMATPSNQPSQAEEIPLGQRLFDRPFLLLVFGLVVMFVFYTIWGLYEVMSLPQATLP
jgi:type VI protein secretion system component VasF